MSHDQTWIPPEHSEEQGGLDIWGFIKRRIWFVLLLAGVGVGLGYIHYERQPREFVSTALMEIIHRAPDSRIEGMMVERNLSDAEYVIRSREILIPAFTNHDLQSLETLRGKTPEAAADAISGMVSVAIPQSGKSNIVQLSCRGPNPNDTAKIANAVAREYITHQKSNYETSLTDIRDLLTRITGDLVIELEDAEKKYAEFRRRTRISEDGSNVHETRLAEISTSISSLIIEETEAAARLQTLEQMQRGSGQREALLLLIGKASDGTATPRGVDGIEQSVQDARTLQQALFPLMMEEARLEQKVGADHPDLIEVRERIRLTRQHWADLAGLRPEQKTGPAEPPPDFIDIYLQSLRQELMVLKQRRIKLEDLAQREESSAQALIDERIESDRQRSDIERKKAVFENTNRLLSEMRVNADMGGVIASVLNDARYGSLAYPKLTQFLVGGGFLGAFLGLALGYIVEIADRSFRKPEEIIREFNVPIVGHIPFMQERKLKEITATEGLTRTVISRHLPQSRAAEAYRSVRTAICFGALGKDCRVLQVTSPMAGDGKSTLSINLAVSLAQSGKRTVLVESDFRRPKVHEVAGIANRNGVTDLLAGRVELADAVQPTDVPDFFVIPCGKKPQNPSELLTRPEYEQLLQLLREKFEYVIVDTPPVLAVTDPCSVAPRADAVLLCMRLSRQTRDFGRRSLEQLRDVGANVAGLVVNGVEEADGYGYGNYNYSDYRYNYRNNSYRTNSYAYGDEYYPEDSSREAASA